LGIDINKTNRGGVRNPLRTAVRTSASTGLLPMKLMSMPISADATMTP